MRHRSRAFGALALATAAPLLAAAEAEDGVTVEITVTELRNTKGVVMACMTDNPDIFPRCREDPDSFRTTVPAAETLTLRFTGVPAGTYAIALLHDENENGRSDRALTLIPREGYGFSNDAPVRMGPPDFEDAEFTVGDTEVHQQIRMRYWL